LVFPNDKSSTPKELTMELKLELQISIRAKSSVTELVSIKRGCGSSLGLEWA